MDPATRHTFRSNVASAIKISLDFVAYAGNFLGVYGPIFDVYFLGFNSRASQIGPIANAATYLGGLNSPHPFYWYAKLFAVNLDGAYKPLLVIVSGVASGGKLQLPPHPLVTSILL